MSTGHHSVRFLLLCVAAVSQVSFVHLSAFSIKSANCSLRLRGHLGTTFTLTFEEFQTERGRDFLYVYDGSSDAAPLLGKFSDSGADWLWGSNSCPVDEPYRREPTCPGACAGCRGDRAGGAGTCDSVCQQKCGPCDETDPGNQCGTCQTTARFPGDPIASRPFRDPIVSSGPDIFLRFTSVCLCRLCILLALHL